MKKNYSRSTKVLVILTTLMFVVANAAPANAANKTITCYKGATVKKVTAAKPKCPTGYTTTKPKVTTKPTVPAAAATVAFSGTYKGSLAIVWGDTYLQVTSVTGKGTGNVLGLTDLSGTAAAAPAGLCDSFDAKGSIVKSSNLFSVFFSITKK
jgi:flagellar hook assembly protein FlgD